MTVMNLEKYKILALVAPEFEDLEFWVPVFRLREEGAQVIIAGAKASETYKGKGGLLATSDVSFNGVEADEFDGLIIPGGWAPDKLRRYDSVKYLVHALNQRHKIIGMICHAGLVGITLLWRHHQRFTGHDSFKRHELPASIHCRVESY